MTEDTKSPPTPPYASFITFTNALDQMREEGIPAIIDNSVFTNLSGSSRTQLYHALKYLGLMKEDGTPSEELKIIVGAQGEDRKKLIRALLDKKFPEQIGVLTSNGTPNQFNSTFDAFGLQASVRRKCKAFVVKAALEAGIEVSPHILKASKSKQKNNASPKPKRAKALVSPTTSQEHMTSPSRKRTHLEGLAEMPIPLGPGKTWYVYVPEDYEEEDAKRFLQVVSFALGAGTLDL